MFWLFDEKNLMPGDFYRLPAGDKVVLQAFYEYKIGLKRYKRRK